MRVRPALAIGGMLDGCSVHGLGTAAIPLHRIYGTRLTVEIGRHQTNVVFRGCVAINRTAICRFGSTAAGIGCGVRSCGRMRDAFLWSLQNSQIRKLPKPILANGGKSRPRGGHDNGQRNRSANA